MWIKLNAFALGRGASFGASTTHIGKLLPKVANGSIGGCPLLVFGITKKLYIEDVPSVPVLPASKAPGQGKASPESPEGADG